MSTEPAFRTKLSDVSDSVAGLSHESTQEAAAFGLIVDWELVKILKRAGWHLLRLSFTWKDDEVLMVVKLRVDETQYVVFVSRPDPMGCMRTLIRKIRGGSVALYPDRFS